MQNLLFFFFGFCGLLTSSEKPFDSVWKHRRETRPLNTIEILPVSDNSYALQFVADRIDTGTINGMIRKAVKFDSLLERSKSGVLNIFPERPIENIGNQSIAYVETIKVRVDNVEYMIFAFSTNKGEAFIEHDCYKFFVVEKLGTIFAYHQLQYSSYDEVESYTLSDIRDKAGKSLVNQKVLNELAEKAKFH
jgi:hypothetical protein